MNNIRSQDIIRSRIEQIRSESPWMEEYEIEAIICTEMDIDPDKTPDSYFALEAALHNTRAEKPQQSKEAPLTVEEVITKDYAAMPNDVTGRFSAYEPVNRGAAQRKDMGTRALYTLTEQSATSEHSSAILEKARITISRNIKNEVNRVGFTLVVFVLLQLLISVALVVIFAVVSYSSMDKLRLSDIDAFITNSRNMSFLHAGLLLLGLAIPFIVYVFVHKLPIQDMVPLHKLRKGEFWPMLWMGLGVLTLSGCLKNYVTNPAAVRGAFYNFDSISLGTSGLDIAISVTCLGIIPALIETFVFNGVIMQALRRRGGDSYALLVSSLLFALLTTNFYEMPGAFLSCMWLGYLVVYSGSLIPAVAARLLERVLFVAVTQIGFSMQQDVIAVHYIDCAISIVIFAFAIFSVRTALKRFPEMFVLKKSDPCLTVWQKVGISFSRVSVVILIVYSIIFSLLQLESISGILSTAEGIIYG